MLELNCGFRHVDLGELRKVDIVRDKKKNPVRIVIQRNKLKQQVTAPVISYKLWNKTAKLLKQCESDDDVYVFRNSRGGSVEDSLKSWFKDWRIANPAHVAAKRKLTLNMIRKTGSTTIAKFDDRLDEWYLGECLDSTTKVSYSFVDGEPNDKFDDALDYLGSVFGFAECTSVTARLTPDMVAVLREKGFKQIPAI
jgi:hypothetical protein